MIKYSIIIPIYNVEVYLRDCIDSVLMQDVESSFEIILIDDGSPDNCGKICNDYAQKYQCIKALHIKNHGVSYARNLGISEAVGEYIIFLDADDLWEQGLLRCLDQLTLEKPDMTSISCSRLFDNGQKEPCFLEYTPSGESGKIYLFRLFEKNRTPWFYTWSYSYRREFLLNHNLFFPEDLNVSEDFVQIMNSIPLAKSIVGCNKPYYLYRVREGSATSNISIKKLMDNIQTKAVYFRKYNTAAMANIYADNALLIAHLPKEEICQVKTFLKSNKDIWNYVTETPLKFGRMLTGIFGFYYGSKVYAGIRYLYRKIKSIAVN